MPLPYTRADEFQVEPARPGSTAYDPGRGVVVPRASDTPGPKPPTTRIAAGKVRSQDANRTDWSGDPREQKKQWWLIALVAVCAVGLTLVAIRNRWIEMP